MAKNTAEELQFLRFIQGLDLDILLNPEPNSATYGLDKLIELENLYISTSNDDLRAIMEKLLAAWSSKWLEMFEKTGNADEVQNVKDIIKIYSGFAANRTKE